MKLRDWLEKKHLNGAQFAPMIYVTKATVYHWLSGRCKPTPHFQIVIMQVTNNKVTPKDWEK